MPYKWCDDDAFLVVVVRRFICLNLAVIISSFTATVVEAMDPISERYMSVLILAISSSAVFG